MMRTGILLIVLPGLLLLASCSQEPGANPTEPESDAVFAGGGFDQYGFNCNAQRFKGAADGADWTLDGMYFGKTRHAGDELGMKWNDEWERGISECWTNPPYKAKCSYMWKCCITKGNTTLWSYDIIWVGEELRESPLWKPNGFPIWERFEVLFSGRTAATIDFWETQELPEGCICPVI